MAVLSVVAYHLDATFLPGGFIGVDIFFVFSGYVVTRSLAAHADERLGNFLLGFYSRRILRILPALLVCIVVTVLFDILFIPHAWLSEQNFDTARYALAGLSNVFLANHQEGYFAPRAEFNPYLHTWSLGVEEQFYLLLPVLWFAIWGGPTRRFRFRIECLGALCLVSFGWSAYLSTADPSHSYYSIFSRFWELGIGACLAEYHKNEDRPLIRNIPDAPLFWVALALLALGICLADAAAFPVPWALPAVAGSVMFIDRLQDRRRPLRAWLVAAPILYVGTISYSIYLWHWPVLALFRWTIGLGGGPVQSLALATIAVLSVASYHLVERAFRPRDTRPLGRARIVATGLTSIALALLSVNTLNLWSDRLTLSTTRDVRVWYPADWSSLKKPGGLGVGCHSVQTRFPLLDEKVIVIRREGCERNEITRTLFVAGDSHAGAYLSLLAKLATDMPTVVRLYSKGACPFYALDRPTTSLSENCRDFIRATLRDIKSTARPGDILFLPSLRIQRISEQMSEAPIADPIDSVETQRQRNEAVAEAQTSLSTLDRMSVDIVFEAPKPIFRAPPFRCSDWFNRFNPICAPGFSIDAAFLQARRLPVLIQMEALKAGMKHMRVWDPFMILCPGPTCDTFESGVPMFFDANHLSAAGNFRLYPSFAKFLDSRESD